MSFFNMTENLYEFNDLTNSNNSLNVISVRSGYPTHSTTSLQPIPVFTHEHQRFEQSPTTTQNGRFPLLNVPHNEGFWNHTQLEKSMLNETMNSQLTYSLNVAEALHGLESFAKTFSSKKSNTVFINSLEERNSEDIQLSEILLSPPRGTPSSGSDRDTFSPVTMHSRPLQYHNQLMHPDKQDMAYNTYQSQHYGYQHYKPQLRENHLGSVSFNKSQSQYQNQENQIQQQLSLYLLPQQKQQIPLDVQEGHESAGSPTNGYTQEQKASEQTVFQTHTSHLQGSQNFFHTSYRSDLYQHQQSLAYEDPFEAAEIMPRFVIQTEEIYMDLNDHHRQENFCSSHYQNVESGENQTAQSPAPREGVLHHLNSSRPLCGQMVSSDFQIDKHKHYYRTESQMAEGTKKMLKCILCRREFKSLPALNGHMRSHGGFRTNPLILKTNEEQTYLSEEASPTDLMVFPVSVPVKDYAVPIHFYNQHNDLNTSDKSPSRKQKRVIPSRKKIFVEPREGASKWEKKRHYHCLVPLVISPCGAEFESRGPVLFQSRMRSPISRGDGISYTPPPMLSPIRPGSGLFNSVNVEQSGTGAQSVSRVRFLKDNDCNATLDSENNSSSIKPRINIGCNFQAEIPEIQSLSKVPDDMHKANLLWTPCYIDTPVKKQRVDDLLKMACSSVLPGGGTNTEYTLHCLFESCGDVMKTLENLLSFTASKQRSGHQTNYHYAGSDQWTLQEKRQFNKALIIYNKDFYLVQKMIKTKSVAQCVEYYYTWKAKLRLGKKLGTGAITPGQVKANKAHLMETNVRQSARKMKTKTERLKFTDLSENISKAFVPTCDPILNGNEWYQTNIDEQWNYPAEDNQSKSFQHFVSSSVKSSPSNSSTSGDTESNLIFPCIECGKVFLKVKSRNAHMKTHRQRDDLQFWQLYSCPEQENRTGTSASPTFGPLPVTHYSVSFSKNGEQTKQVFNEYSVTNKAENFGESST